MLALWLPQLCDEGLAVLPAALAAVQGDDEPHRIDDQADLGLALSDLAAEAELSHAALPVSGAAGVPAAATDDALVAGEAALIRGGAETTVLIPHVQRFGSVWEPGALVHWQLRRTSDIPPMPLSMSEARGELTQALELAIETLTHMDVAKWREEDAHEIAQLASAEVPPSIAAVLPRDLPHRQQDLLVRSARLLAIVDLAVADDGAAVNLWQADQRATAMRHVATTARRAMVAATTWASQDSTSR